MLISSLLLLTTLFSISMNNPLPGPVHFYGAWEMKNNNFTTVKIFTPTYFIYSTYDSENKEFLEAGGGTWSLTEHGISEYHEFNTANSELVGVSHSYSLEGSNNGVEMTYWGQLGGKKTLMTWTRIDDGESPLFGAWRITQRKQNGQMSAMQQGPRKTMKVLSGTRFQWAAFNIETREFSGTGGGIFTTEDGKYTESIEFFSRDNSRVGASLEFDFSVQGKDWHHKGLSSKGDPIYEIWTNQDK